MQVLVTTGLEPYNARRMLPCLDVPNLKATFSFSVQAPQKLVVRSTMAEGFSRPGFEPGTTLHQFATTPKMSTYLIGITVGHMVSSSAMSASGKNISVWSVPALAEQHTVALQVRKSAMIFVSLGKQQLLMMTCSVELNCRRAEGGFCRLLL